MKNNQSVTAGRKKTGIGMILAVTAILSSCAVSAETGSSSQLNKHRTVHNMLLSKEVSFAEQSEMLIRGITAGSAGIPEKTGSESTSSEASVKESASSPTGSEQVNGSQTAESSGPVRNTESSYADDSGTDTNHTESNEPSHVHSWTDLTETVHHPAVTHTVHHEAVTGEKWVWDTEPWDEPVYTSYNICNVCGFREGMDEDTLFDHIENEHGGQASYHYEKIETGTIHHEGTGHNETYVIQEAYDETVTDQPAWDETVVTGQICNGCGAIK